MHSFNQPADPSNLGNETSSDPLASRHANASSGHSLYDVVALSSTGSLLSAGTAIGADQHFVTGAAPETPLDRAIRRLLLTNRDQVKE
jgi:hypothetical protein